MPQIEPPVFAGTAVGEGGLAETALLSLFDEWAHGIVVVTVHAEVLLANHVAQAELSGKTGLSLSNGRLQSSFPDQQKSLMWALARAQAGLRSVVILATADGTEVTFAVLPVRSAQPPVRVALVFARASLCDALMLCFFARNYGLTTTEEQVLGYLCQGMSAPEIAKRMRIAVSTVRSHVRSLCGKTQSSGARTLLRRVSQLPPLGTTHVQSGASVH